MIVKPFKYENHAEQVRQWGAKHSFPLPSPQMLPETGFIVEGYGCGFLYCTNSSLGWLEWVFSNPEKTKEDRKVAIDLIFKAIEDTARVLKIEALFSASGFKGYSEILDRNGFKETEKNMSHFIKLLGGESS